MQIEWWQSKFTQLYKFHVKCMQLYYYVFFEQFSIIDYIQLTHLIRVAKHRCLKIANNEVIAKWNCHNYYTQTILLAQFTVKLLLI